MLRSLKKLLSILTKRDKKLIFLIFLLSIIVSIVEMVGISVIMPFIAVASDFSLVESNEKYKYIYELLGFSSPLNFVLVFGISLIGFYLFRSGFNLFYFYVQARFTHSRYYLIVYRLFENYLGMRYKDFIKNNSSTLTKTIVSEASSLTMMINAYLMILSESVVLIMIYSMMIYVNVEITLVITAFLGINAILLTKVITKKVKKQGKIRENTQRDFYKIINKSFGDFKFIKLQNSDQKIMQEFSTVSSDYSQSNIKYTTLSHFPRLFLEAVGFSMIIFMIVFYIWQKEIDIKEILPTITMFVLALYRLMPSANRIMTAYNQINFQYKALDIIHNDLMYDVESLGDERVEFKEKIYLKDICFGYDSDKLLFQGFDIEIKKGDKVAFIGESGSGKSTLVDILMGLHKPLDGDIYIDDNKLTDENVKDWKSKIGYIPQAVYLFDGTVADNIVFGREYDEGRLVDVLKKANIYHFLMEKDGLDTLVGENGVMLSGGQKQRIAIARALYDNPDILVLDEATSALDDDTESKIMDEIYNSSTNKTLIIIAHRLSTIDRCNVVYKLDKGKIVQ